MALSIAPFYLHWGLIDFNVTVSTASDGSTLPQGRIIPFRNGEHIPFVFSRGELTTDGWVCNITVKKIPADTSLISRTIELSSGGVWAGYLTSTETTALANGTYRLTGVLTNSTSDEEQQQSGRFNISDSWA